MDPMGLGMDFLMSKMMFFFVKNPWIGARKWLQLLMATRNPARKPVEVGSWNPIIYRVLYIPGGCLGFLPSTVMYHILAPFSDPKQVEETNVNSNTICWENLRSATIVVWWVAENTLKRTTTKIALPRRCSRHATPCFWGNHNKCVIHIPSMYGT